MKLLSFKCNETGPGWLTCSTVEKKTLFWIGSRNPFPWKLYVTRREDEHSFAISFVITNNCLTVCLPNLPGVFVRLQRGLTPASQEGHRPCYLFSSSKCEKRVCTLICRSMIRDKKCQPLQSLKAWKKLLKEGMLATVKNFKENTFLY